jgi:hypothetical protein
MPHNAEFTGAPPLRVRWNDKLGGNPKSVTYLMKRVSSLSWGETT